MPSPFPGMDPYLEGSLWMSVHSQLAVEIARQLTPRLVPRYIALTPKRFVWATPDPEEGIAVAATSFYPDAAVAEAGPARPGGRGSAAALMEPPLRLATLIPEPVPHITVEIRDTADRRLVTAIEVLSPTNKRGDGRDEYLERRRRFLVSSAHLVEIDLLRMGERVPMQKPLPQQPYFVFLSRADIRPLCGVWPIPLGAPLPTVPVPLLPGDPDVPLDLQQALSSVYDDFGYVVAIDYTRAPEIPLRPEEAAWVKEQLGIPRSSSNGPARTTHTP